MPFETEKTMSRKCDLTGKRAMRGKKVSHSNVKSLKHSLPNLQKKRIWVPSLNRFELVKVSTRALRTISKVGADALLGQHRKKCRG